MLQHTLAEQLRFNAASFPGLRRSLTPFRPPT
jgi:hypothetical protein